MFRGIAHVLTRPRYALAALMMSAAVFYVSVWIPNLELLGQLAHQESVLTALRVAFSMYHAIGTNFTLFAATLTIALALLTGINLALVLYLLRHKARVGGASISGFAGMVFGIFGVGCAACGSVILTGILASIGGASLLALLPYHGAEFAVLGVALALYALHALGAQVHAPNLCVPTSKHGTK